MAPPGSVTGGAIDLSEGEKGHEGTNVEAQRGFHVCVWVLTTARLGERVGSRRALLGADHRARPRDARGWD
jgi:hypothetical protein